MAAEHDFEKETEWLVKSAKKINSVLDYTQKQQLLAVKLFSRYLAIFGGESLLAAGSCVEGTKVNTPDVKGDIDIMFICGNIELLDDDFIYIDEHPAFMYIKQNHTHEFNNFEHNNDRFLPACMLKNFSKSCFYMLRVALMILGTLPRMTSDGCASCPIPSDVGVEEIHMTGVSGVDPRAIVEDKFLEIYPTILKCIPNFFAVVKNVSKRLNQKCNIWPEWDMLLEAISTLASTIKDSEKKKKGESLINGSLNFLRDSVTILSSCIEPITTPTPTAYNANEKQAETHGVIIKELTTDTESNGTCTNPDISHSEEETTKHSDRPEEPDVVFNNNLDTSSDEEIVNESLAERQSLTPPASTDKYELLPTNGSYTTEMKVATDKDSSVMATKASVTPKANYWATDLPDDNMTVISASHVLRSTDFVPAFRCIDWPRTAAEWVTRSREWPAADIQANVIASGCLVVAKCPPNVIPRSDAPDCYFRLSFSHAEILLADTMLPTQKLCWKILKAYQIGYLRSEPKILTSYHWKTAMLWVSEQKSECFWVESNICIAVKEVLGFMVECLENGVLPHYFVKNMNLISGSDRETANAIHYKIQDIRESPASYLRDFIKNPPKPRPCTVELSRGNVDVMREVEIGKPFERFIDEVFHGLEESVIGALHNSTVENMSGGMKAFVNEVGVAGLQYAAGASGVSKEEQAITEQCVAYVTDVACFVAKTSCDSKSVKASDGLKLIGTGFTTIENLCSSVIADREQGSKKKRKKKGS